MLYSNRPVTFKLCLVKAAHQLALKFSSQQKDLSKVQQVYHNTLAVWAVNYYMKCMQIETDWESSDSWDILMQSLLNVADLILPGIGSLECRPFVQGEQSVYIPLDVSQDRIAYVIVQLDNSLKTATILGFVKTAPVSEELPITKIRTLKEFLKYLEQIKMSNLEKPVKLSQWLRNIFGDGWQPIEALLSTALTDGVFGIRSTSTVPKDDLENLSGARRGKLIDLGIQIGIHPIALVVTIIPLSDEEVDINVRLYPAKGHFVLPPNLQMIFLDEADEVIWSDKTRNADNWMQQGLSGKIGETFSVKLILEERVFIEYFII